MPLFIKSVPWVWAGTQEVKSGLENTSSLNLWNWFWGAECFWTYLIRLSFTFPFLNVSCFWTASKQPRYTESASAVSTWPCCLGWHVSLTAVQPVSPATCLSSSHTVSLTRVCATKQRQSQKEIDKGSKGQAPSKRRFSGARGWKTRWGVWGQEQKWVSK